MTEQERRLIENLIQRVQSAPSPQIDRDADALIRRGLGNRSDALYILTQTVLLQDLALNQTREQNESPGFLGMGGGNRGGYEQPRGRFSGFLQNAAQTAAGVIAGEVAFSALASLFGGGHHGGYGGSGFLGGGADNDQALSSGLSPDLEDHRFDNADSDLSDSDSSYDDSGDV